MTTLSSSWQLIASNGLTFGTLKIYAYATQSGNKSTVHTLLRITVSQWYSANRVRAGITGGNNYYYNNNSSPKAFAIGDHDLIEGSYTVNHNANGSASTTISYWLDQSYGGSAYSDTSPGSVTVNLPSTKPAAGDATRITINASPTYNSVTLSFSGGTPGSGASISYYRVKGLGYSNYTKVSNPVTITGLTPNTSYTFTVDFVDNYGTEASKSTSKTFTTLKPAAPTKGSVSASNITYNGAKLSWSGFSFGDGATWGKYQYSWDNSEWIDCGTNTSLTITNRSPNTSYTFYVRLVDNYGTASNAASVTFTTEKKKWGLSTVFIKVDGQWKRGIMYYKNDGTWVQAKGIFIRTEN